MSRMINVSTEVFAAIWARRKAGEESEDAILQRLLSVESSGEDVSTMGLSGGCVDARNRVHFPEGFEIFRTYKRREYRAEAKSGAWFRKDNGQRYPTLNQLNGSIAAGAENVWNGTWKFRASDGSIRSIAELRR